MKRLISISLIFCLTIQTLTSVSFLTVYQFNSSFITEVFCVNKTQPALHCEGKCFVKKQLTKDKEAREQSARSTETLAFYLFMPPAATVCLDRLVPDFESPVAFYNRHLLASPFFSTFHPPKAFC
jgi:hypothetical protein